MPSLKDMREKAKEAGLMKLDKLISVRQRIPNCELPIPIKELCERYEKLYTGCINDVMREFTLLDQNLPSDIMDPGRTARSWSRSSGRCTCGLPRSR